MAMQGRHTVTLAPLSADLLNSAKEASASRKTGASSQSSTAGLTGSNGGSGSSSGTVSSTSAPIKTASNGLTPFSPASSQQATSAPRRGSGGSSTPSASGGSDPSDQPQMQKANSGPNLLQLNQSGNSKMGAKLKMNELYKYWATLPETQKLLKAMVDSSLAQVEQSKGKKGNNGGASNAGGGGNPQEDSLVVGSDDLEFGSPKEQVAGDAPFVVVEPVPPSDGASSPPRVDRLNLSGSASVTTPNRSSSGKDNLSPKTSSLRPHSPVPKSPRDRSGAPLGSSPHHPGDHRPSPGVSHIVDELDMAHRRGGLSPRVKDLAPGSTSGGSGEQASNRPVSPMEFALVPNQDDFHPTSGTKLLRLHSNGDAGLSGKESSSNLSRRGSLSDLSNGKSGLGSESSRSNSPVHSSRSEIHGASASISAKQVPTPVFPVASAEDIPPFYFTAGKRLKENEVVQLEASAIHPNCPPTLPPAVQKQQQEMLQQAMAEGGGGGAGVFSNGVLEQPQPINIPALVAMVDSKVEEFVAKNFSSIKSSPSASSSSSAAGSAVLARRAIRSGQGNRKNSTSNNTKSDAVHWQHISAAMHRITTQCFGLPGYFSRLIIAAIVKKTETGEVRDTDSISSTLGGGARTLTVSQVMDFYNLFFKGQSIVRRMFNVLIASSKHPTSKDINKLTRNHLLREDFALPLEVLLELHPGLAFLRQAQDFQSKYVDTVILRIFYDVDVHDRGKITWPEFERSKLPEVMRQVDVIEDINSVLNYFSYEHFYVIYCRFWELDEDKDGKISPEDLEHYTPEGCLNPQIIERVFKGHGRRLSCATKNKMNYEDFVYFCLSEEDKSHPRAIRYWFRILDTDGDGVLSGYELENFYNYTKSRMIMITSECIQFPDVMCQIRDMLPYEDEGPTLADLLRYPQSAFVGLNMITNVAKFLQFEQRDPFVAHQDRLAGGLEKTEWDRFARNEYNRMAMEAEEG